VNTVNKNIIVKNAWEVPIVNMVKEKLVAKVAEGVRCVKLLYVKLVE
jgi:hypothetical protein